MGSTLLCLPWALHQAGLYFGLGMMLGMLYLCFYTADLIVKIPQLAHIKCQEFSDACAILLGRWAQTLVAISSLISLLGTCIVYWVLMTNFMYHIVSYVFELVVHNSTVTISMHGTDDVFCDVTPSQNPNFSALSFPSAELADAFDSDSLFYRFWDMQTTAPFALGLILIPIIFIRSPAVFMKVIARRRVARVIGPAPNYAHYLDSLMHLGLSRWFYSWRSWFSRDTSGASSTTARTRTACGTRPTLIGRSRSRVVSFRKLCSFTIAS